MTNRELADKLKEKLLLIENLPSGLASISPPLKDVELRQIIAALEAEEWVSVEEKLPHDNPGDWRQYEIKATAYFGYEGNEITRPAWEDEIEYEIRIDVTHWRPLPAPPKP